MEQKALRRLRDWAHGDPDWVRRDPFGRFSASAGSRRPADRVRGTRQERATLERVASEGMQAFTVDLPGGYRAEAHTSQVEWGGRSVQISGTIVSEDGRTAGDFTRVIGYADPDPDEESPGLLNPDGSTVLEAYHSSAVLFREHRTQGLLSALNGAAAMWYDSLGIDQIRVGAVDIGGYAWARHGFNWDRSEDNPGGTVPVKLRMARDQLAKSGGWEWGITDPEVAAKILADLDVVIADGKAGFPTFTPRDVAMLGYEDVRWTETIKGQEVVMWPGKAVMLDSYWNGVDRDYQENAARASQLALAKNQTAPEGFSYDPVTGRHPTEGYMVSLRGYSQRFPYNGDREALARIVSDYIDNFADVFEDPAIYMGGWYDKANREFVLDPSENVLSLVEARRLARERNQQAIYDVVEKDEIPTHGTGDR